MNHKCSRYILLAITTLISTTIQSTPMGDTKQIDFKSLQVNFNAIEASLGFPLSVDIKKYYTEIDKEGIAPAIDPLTQKWVEYRNIDGWFDKRLIIILALLDHAQATKKIVGNLGEIGVWMGRSFIPLIKLARHPERVLGVDCFEKFQANLDKSGGAACSFKRLMKNIHKYSFDTSHLRFIKGDSYTLTAENFLQTINNGLGFRLFSIDGCHEAAHTERDMLNAFNVLVDGGIIIIDDYFNICWPGVSEGVSRFMHNHKADLKPFFIGWNKIFFTQPAHAEEYKELIKKILIPRDTSCKKFFDEEVLIYDPKF